MTFFRRRKVSSSLLQCDLLNPSKKPSGNSTQFVMSGLLCLYIPFEKVTYLHWKFRPMLVWQHVYNQLLASAHAWNFFLPRWYWKLSHILNGVWSTFIVSSSGTLYVCTKVQMSCKNNVKISIYKASVTIGLDVITVLRAKFIFLCKKYSQPSVAVNSKYPSGKCKLFFIKPINTP